MSTSSQILQFLFNLPFNVDLPADVEVLNPFKDPYTRQISSFFYNRFYGDEHSRYCIIGINPGRFGGGVTGIPFTDPIRLKSACGIDNTWQQRQELSSVFMYEMIDAFGGAEKFYQQFYITSFSPLGFTSKGKNLNYYDDKTLIKIIQPFALHCMKKQLRWANTSVAFVLGEGANYKFISKFNEEHKLFSSIVPLAHPRFIMQYKLKSKEAYIAKYLGAFGISKK